MLFSVALPSTMDDVLEKGGRKEEEEREGGKEGGYLRPCRGRPCVPWPHVDATARHTHLLRFTP